MTQTDSGLTAKSSGSSASGVAQMVTRIYRVFANPPPIGSLHPNLRGTPRSNAGTRVVGLHLLSLVSEEFVRPDSPLPNARKKELKMSLVWTMPNVLHILAEVICAGWFLGYLLRVRCMTYVRGGTCLVLDLEKAVDAPCSTPISVCYIGHTTTL